MEHYSHYSRDIRKSDKVAAGFALAYLIFIWVWIIIGISAFITSLFCFSRNGRLIDKIIGLVLAIFFGPFYFLFYAFNSDYCKKSI
jgi:hypothetical protein